MQIADEGGPHLAVDQHPHPIGLGPHLHRRLAGLVVIRFGHPGITTQPPLAHRTIGRPVEAESRRPCEARAMATPPAAPRRPTVLTAHGDQRIDDWYWLRDRDDPEVIGYLEAENDFTREALAHTEPLQEKLFEEIKSRIQETDLSAPVRKGDYWYYSRTVEGMQYGIHCRKQGSLEADEEVLLDENLLAEGHDFFALGAFSISPSHRLLIYSTDTEGNEVYTVRVRDLATGEDHADAIPGTYYGTAWANDEEHLFYTTVNAAMRPWRLHRHRLGTDPGEDVIVHQEDDEAFYLGVGRTKTDAFILLSLNSKTTSEVHYLAADDATGS
ncbi:MAG: oligopeptidase, partial [Acidimicrobiaceae bacterium]|nr:oligopeptidase [Acidimicrobiaceae bacterium]